MTPKKIIQELKPCSWKYNDKIKGLGDKIHYGFIAQDLLKSFGPDFGFVNENEEYLTVNYNEFIGPIVAVLQQHEKIIKLQEEKILQLEKIIKELKK